MNVKEVIHYWLTSAEDDIRVGRVGYAHPTIEP